MNQDMTEILINKYLDSEITPAEQRLLQAQLQQNPQARQLLEQMQQLNEQMRQAVEVEVRDAGDDMEIILERAWAEATTSETPGRRRWPMWFRIAGNLAAGFLLGLLVYGAVSRWFINRPEAFEPQPQSNVVIMRPIPADQPNPDALSRMVKSPNSPDPDRLVDWYQYTEPDGSQWLFETYRPGQVEPAGYNGDL